jgi:hypothetical protein
MDIKAVLDRKLEERKARIDEEKTLIKDAIRGFMDDHPEVEFLGVKTYTPSFNDGDPCEFTITDPQVILKGSVPDPVDDQDDPEEGEDEELDDDEDEDDEDGPDFDEYGQESYQIDENEQPKLRADLETLGELFNTVEEAFEDLFGNGSSIVVGRDGEAKVTEYDCGY